MRNVGVRIVDDHTTELWGGLVPVLSECIAIPARSPAFDADWAATGHLDRAVDLVTSWCRSRPIPGLTVTVHRLEGRTPVVVCEIPATPGAEHAAPVLLYGHLDKQPEMEGWRAGLGPWTPVLEGDRLYGRGGADDGYSAFAVLGAIEAVQAAEDSADHPGRPARHRGRPAGGAARHHVAAAAHRGRPGRPAAHRPGRQRAAPRDHAAAVAAHPPVGRPRRGAGRPRAGAHHRPAPRRPGHRQRRERRLGLGGSSHGAVARRGRAGGVRAVLRDAAARPR